MQRQNPDFGKTLGEKKKDKARTISLLALKRKVGQVLKNSKKLNLMAIQRTSPSLINRAQKIHEELLHLKRIRRKALKRISLTALKTLAEKLHLVKK